MELARESVALQMQEKNVPVNEFWTLSLTTLSPAHTHSYYVKFVTTHLKMFITTLCAPLTALYVCGSVASTVILMTVGGCLAVYLISDVDPGMIGTADITSACVSTAVVALYFGVALYMIYWRNIESYFCSFPWLTTTSASREKVGGRVYQRLCPFTGQFYEYEQPN